MRLLLVCLVAVLLAPAHAKTTESEKEVARLRQLAQTYEKRGRAGDAKRYLHEALSLAPTDATILGDLLRLTVKQQDEFSLWAHVLARRATDERGTFKQSKALTADIARAIQPVLKIAQIRAGAVDRLAAQAKRLRRPADAPAAHYLRALARACTREVPALRKKHGTLFDDAVARCAPDGGAVLAVLERGMKKALGEGRVADAMTAAHILRGACVQARRNKLKVRRLQAMETAAVLVMRKIRKDAAAATAPGTIDDLRKIPKDKRPEWEADHSDWTNPTIVLSPNARYRIESVCGVRTTLMAALDIESCHDRLVKWFGSDPFAKVQGTVRLCRSPADLEGEGQPHYWAGGFQSGNITTIVVHASSRNGIAGTLTHELTHRFDGRLLPGMPGWLVEGRAVYTAGGSLWPRAGTIDVRAANFGAFYNAMTKGYRNRKTLRKLIEGTPDDYRDNYQAGYSLWVYLTRYRGKLYAARVEPYLKSFRAKPGWPAMQRFANFFLDGKQGRGKSFPDFAKDFGKFINEGGAIDSVAWKKAWRAQNRAARIEAEEKQREVAKDAKGELASPYDRAILDKSNWQTFRNRSDDPAFGEKHAYSAGLWFESQRMRDAALLAFAWARAIDELAADRLLHIAAAYAQHGKPAEAWLNRLAARGRSLDPVDLGRTPAPVAQLQQHVRPLLRTLANFELGYRGRTLKRSARALLADRVILANAAGIDPGKVEDDAGPLGKDRVPPDCEPYESVLDGGLVEEYWAPSESNINKSYHIGGPGLLVMGRRKAKKGETSGFARDAGVRKTFVRGTKHYDGTYTLRVRVKFISAHLGGAIVLGHTRKDRGLILQLNGGDWAYAVGRKKEGFGFPHIDVRLNDLRSYDGGVSRLRRRVEFRTPRTSCLVTVHVSGSFVQVFVDDQEARSHRTATGLPIEGRIGFYLGSGQVAFDKPEVRRHRAIGPMATCPCRHADEPLDLTQPSRLSWYGWQGRRIKGVPRDPLGTVLLLYPRKLWKDHDAQQAYDLWRRNLGKQAVARVRVAYPKGAEVPEAWPKGILVPHAGLPRLHEDREAWLKDEAQRSAGRNKDQSETAALRRLHDEGAARPPWIAIDPRGIVRSRAMWFDAWWAGTHRALLHRLRGW